MPEPGTDPVRPDDAIEAPQAAHAPKRVCIISGDPLRPRAFMAALDPVLRANEDLTIIVDRRRPSSESAAERPSVERRRHPSVDAKVKTDGFAIVPQSTVDPPWIQRLFPPQPPDDDADASELAIQRILEFKRRRRARVGPLLGPLLGVSAVVGVVVVLVVLFVQMPAGKGLVNRSGPIALPTPERTAEPPTQVEAPALQSSSTVEAPSPPPRTNPVLPTPERTAEPPTQVQAPAAQSSSVVEAPSPPSRTSPASPPADRVGRPRNAARASKVAVTPPPRSQPSASSQSDRRPASSEPAPPPGAETTTGPLDTQPAPVADVTSPPRPRTTSPPQPAGPASAPEPARVFASDVTPTAQTAAIPADTPARPGSAPRQPSASGTLRELENLVSRDVNTAGEEAKRQIGELRVKTLEKLDEMRRAWSNAKQRFSDPFKGRDKASDEAAAGQRR